TQLERSRLDLAIREVYAQAEHTGQAPRESHLHELLLARSSQETDVTVATVDRSLAERLTAYICAGAYAYPVDRPTTVVTEALLDNSTMQLFVRQSPDELRHVQDALRLTDAEIALISRLKTAKRHYSQAYWINGTRGRGSVTLRVGPALYWAATSDPVRDVPA